MVIDCACSHRIRHDAQILVLSAFGGAVATGTGRRLTERSDDLRIVQVAAERAFNGLQIGPVAVRCDLDAIGEAGATAGRSNLHQIAQTDVPSDTDQQYSATSNTYHCLLQLAEFVGRRKEPVYKIAYKTNCYQTSYCPGN
jgi:hypothetical protein